MSDIEYDISGTELITDAVKDLLNRFPGLEDEIIAFAVLPEGSGMAMFPTQGAIIQQNRESVTGHIYQRCLYPFTVISRAGGLSEGRKTQAKEDLDNLGKWLEGQPVLIGGVVHQLTEYPALSGGRIIKSITRTTPSYLSEVRENMVEDWAVNLQVVYTTEYDK